MRSTRDVIFRAPDLAAVKAYYAGTLGLPVVLDRPGMLGFDAGEFTVFFEPGEPNGAVFEFSVEDLPQAKADLLAAGCVVIEENPAIPRVYVRDPFGLVFNITQD